MLAAQLFGTTGVAVLLLLGKALAAPSYWDVALVFAVLAAVTAIAFVRRAGAACEGRGAELAMGPADAVAGVLVVAGRCLLRRRHGRDWCAFRTSTRVCTR